jgi:hypothetical protein
LKEQQATFIFYTVADLKKKMNGLRTYHRTLWKKRNDIGAIDENTPSWQYYDQMMFLNDHLQPRESMATFPKRKLDVEETRDVDDGEQSDFEYTVNNPGCVTKARRLWTPSHENEVIMKSVECQSTRFCDEKSEEKSAGRSAEKSAEKTAERSPETITARSPEMLFGELVGHSLTNIKDERNREYAKLQIQQILFKCRYPDPPKRNQATTSVQQTNSP